MKMKMKEMECEVLHDAHMQEQMKHAKQRMESMVMSGHEAHMFRDAPNAARGNKHPAYPDMMYGDTTEG